MAPRKAISDIRREELTQAALKCIAQKGYDRVTLDDVTREAGLSKGIASYYFKNRDELLVSVIQSIWDSIEELTRTIWGLPEEADEKEVHKRLRAYFADPSLDITSLVQNAISALVAWINENPLTIRVVLECWCQVPRHPIVTKVNRSMYSLLLTVSAVFIEEGARRGVFRKRDPRMAAHVLISGVTGLAYNLVMNGFPGDNRELEREFHDLVFEYLRG